jgi:hypothetical protein
MAALSIGKAWEESTAFVKREGQLLFPVALLFLAVPVAILFQMIPPEFLRMTPGQKMPPLPGSVQFGLLITAIITLAGSLTIFALALKPGISVGEALRLGIQRLPVLLGAMLLVGAASVVGLSLIAGLLSAMVGVAGGVRLATALMLVLMAYLAVRLLLLNAVVIDRPGGIIESLKAAWNLTAGHFWRLFAFMAVLLVVSSIVQMAVQAVFGVIAGLAGGPAAAQAAGDVTWAAFSAVVQVYLLVMLARIYRQLHG